MTFKKIIRETREDILDNHKGKTLRTKEIRRLLSISKKTHLQDCAFSYRLIKLDNGIYKVR